MRRFRRYKLCNPLPCTILFWLIVFAFYSHYSTTIYSDRSWSDPQRRYQKLRIGVDTKTGHNNHDNHVDKDENDVQPSSRVDTQNSDDNNGQKGKEIQHINAIPRIHKQAKIERSIQSHQQHKQRLDRQNSANQSHQQQDSFRSNQTRHNLGPSFQNSSQNSKSHHGGQQGLSNSSQDTLKVQSVTHDNQTTNTSSRIRLVSRFQRYHKVINNTNGNNQWKSWYNRDRKEVNDSNTTIKNSPSLRKYIHQSIDDSRNESKQSHNNISWLRNHVRRLDVQRQRQEYNRTVSKIFQNSTTLRTSNKTSSNGSQNSHYHATINPNKLQVDNSFKKLTNNSFRNNQTLSHQKNHLRLNLHSNTSSHIVNKTDITNRVRTVFVDLHTITNNHNYISCLFKLYSNEISKLISNSSRLLSKLNVNYTL